MDGKSFIYRLSCRDDMSIMLRVEHSIRREENFDSWKKAFDSDPLGRKKSGVRRYRILRPTDDTNYVMIDMEFDSLKEAENFRSALRNLWGSTEAEKVMQNPKLRIVEQIETKEY
jgi:hypothetical protein